MPSTPRAKTSEVFDFLKRCAAEKRIVTYTEVALEARTIERAVGKLYLHYIGGECRRRGLPPLDALVVRKDDRLPGEGFKPGGVRVTREEHDKMVRDVFAFDWSNVHL